jgi:ribosomal-protein-alanine N-acetyltransferase
VENQVGSRGGFRAVSETSNGMSHYNVAVAFVIREFKPEDFETVWRIDQECFPPGISYTRPELKGYMRGERSFTLVATNDEEAIMGFLVARGGSIGHIITIEVHSSARRSGIGSGLLSGSENRLYLAGCRAIELETAVDNSEALSFYKQHGYRVVGMRPRYYPNGVDALVLLKDLT